jgi:2-methylcitrate dehydratase PrpD
LADFGADSLKDPQVLAVAQKVVPIDDPSLDWKRELPPGRVEIVMTDGRRFERVGRNVPGSVEAPMSWDELVDKFLECASVAPVQRTPGELRAVCDMVQSLETVSDATLVMRALA